MDGKGCYSWNDTSNVYMGDWLGRNRHGDGIYLIVTNSNRSKQHMDKETQNTMTLTFTCGHWKDDHEVKDNQIKFIHTF